MSAPDRCCSLLGVYAGLFWKDGSTQLVSPVHHYTFLISHAHKLSIEQPSMRDTGKDNSGVSYLKSEWCNPQRHLDTEESQHHSSAATYLQVCPKTPLSAVYPKKVPWAATFLQVGATEPPLSQLRRASL